MLLDRPAQFLYGHHRDLYLPMRMLATEYRWILRACVGLAVATIACLLIASW